MKTAILAITDKGWKIAERIRQHLPDSTFLRSKEGTPTAIKKAWLNSDALVCIMSTGIVVRCLQGLCRSKHSDPCVIVLDENGTNVISLLSGHVGGGNALAQKIAAVTGGNAVITTASDISGHTALDLWAIENNLVPINGQRLAPVSVKLINEGSLTVYQKHPYLKAMPEDLTISDSAEGADIIISPEKPESDIPLHLMVRDRFIGLGCKRGSAAVAFEEMLQFIGVTHGLDIRSIAGAASVDLKSNEPGMHEFVRGNGWSIRFFSSEQLNTISVPNHSDRVFKRVGTGSVCEAAALLASSENGEQGRLIIEKVKWKTITAAVAETVYSVS